MNIRAKLSGTIKLTTK